MQGKQNFDSIISPCVQACLLTVLSIEPVELTKWNPLRGGGAAEYSILTEKLVPFFRVSGV